MKKNKKLYYSNGLFLLFITVFQVITAYIYNDTQGQIIKIIVTNLIAMPILFLIIYIYEKLRKY